MTERFRALFTASLIFAGIGGLFGLLITCTALLGSADGDRLRRVHGIPHRVPGMPVPGPDGIVFAAFGDPQTGGPDPGKNRKQIEVLNGLPGRVPLPGSSRRVRNLLGVIIAGDMTEHGYFGEYMQFTKLYGLTGNSRLRWPVYEGYGNHDFRLDREYGRVADAVSIRNRFRPGVVHRAPGKDGHYSWRWGDVHFVMVNLAPADRVRRTKKGRPHEARDALAFLKLDLKRFAANGSRVVIVSHYGFVRGWDIPRWWSRRSVDRFFRTIRGYNVIAFIHGHYHGTGFYRVRGLPVINVGSPFYTRFNRDGRGHLTLFRITRDALHARDIAWDPSAPADTTRYRSRFSVKVALRR